MSETTNKEERKGDNIEENRVLDGIGKELEKKHFFIYGRGAAEIIPFEVDFPNCPPYQ